MYSIIIIDENPDIRHILRLLRAGYQANAAADLPPRRWRLPS
ncbi:MAG: hypothetical protein U0Z44_18935 [Kouleothrix sp.]